MRAHFQRQFLNTEEYGGSAHIEARVGEVEVGRDGDKHVDAQFSVADCNRIVDLDFSIYGAEAAENARVKLRRLVRSVNAFAKAMTAALDEIDRG